MRQRMTLHNNKIEDITIVNLCALKTGAPKYIKQILINIKNKLTITQ